MANSYTKTLTVGLIAASINLVPFLSTETVHAGVLSGDWYYSIDSFNDSMSGNHVGGTIYEIYGMAMKQTADEVIFAVNSHLPYEGTDSQYAQDNHVGWGDLLLNFTGQTLDVASGAAQLFGIRWANNNDSGVSELGLYNNVTAKTIAQENGLLLTDASLRSYNNWVRSKGGNPTIGDLGAEDPYFNQNQHIPNVIASGTKIGEVNLINNIASLGLNFGQFGATGTQTLAFSVARSLLPDGFFTAHLAPECDNDVIAMVNQFFVVEPPSPTPSDIPEPATALSVVAVGLLMGASKLRRENSPLSKLG
ncbi:XDD3 family exosortase-dependent surface protein [Limnoraphis robusta Tam1]|uniref:XDD3 family exosortase-dependent surface protein n=1 Tax=Limnoraphis robusta TaxID=1118279 RepID=UPI002B208691|nr:XDD3 family exosortase-dependent surface protein [Limnoraphis robusta]MEA5543120.1 XDD3 family exosortase-dependent surface protein [Limnoraphis robusta Tam1]